MDGLSAEMDCLHVSAFPQLIATRYTARDGLPESSIAYVRIVGGRVYAGSPERFAVFDGDRWQSPGKDDKFPTIGAAMDTDGLQQEAVVTSAARTPSGSAWVVTTKGAFKKQGQEWVPLELPSLYRLYQPTSPIQAAIRALWEDGAGHIWLASSKGACVTDGADWWHPLNRADGMPYEDMLCLTIAPNGDVWGGATEGAWRLRNGKWRYFWGKRWLPGNRVNDIAVDSEGTAWLATDGGVSRIEERPVTLTEKAAHYEEITVERHIRDGWIMDCDLKVQSDPEAGFIPTVSDNDGLWTSIYVGAEAFRYAVTKDAEARGRCKRSLEAMLDMVRLSGYPGFPVRAIMRKGENVVGYNLDEKVRVPGETDKIWYESPVDPSILCKGDTSSDELDGHYFAWYIYNELVADEKEKKALREVVAAVTDNLLRNNYALVGHTGRKTRWGVFGPQFLNDDPQWFEERGLNSLSLLSHLKIAAYICGDRRYSDAYEDLTNRHHYLLNTLEIRRNVPWHEVNHSDDQLAYLAYYPLLMLEKDPYRRGILLQSITTSWNEIRKERSPLYNFIYGATTGAPCEVEDAVETLRDWPWELISWQVRNNHRHDVTFRTALGVRIDELDRVLPVSERHITRWNGNPWEAEGGKDGMSERDGATWLLPYWMGRYHGLIAE